jgi:hypothetical protein
MLAGIDVGVRVAGEEERVTGVDWELPGLIRCARRMSSARRTRLCPQNGEGRPETVAPWRGCAEALGYLQGRRKKKRRRLLAARGKREKVRSRVFYCARL